MSTDHEQAVSTDLAAAPASALLAGPERATPDWITDALRRSGRLARGRVAGVRTLARETTSTWALHHLEVDYSRGARPAPGGEGRLPGRLLLKITLNAPPAPGVAPHHGLSTGKEVWFYQHVASVPAMAAVPLIH
jgi:hypothetical protein